MRDWFRPPPVSVCVGGVVIGVPSFGTEELEIFTVREALPLHNPI